MAEKNIRTPTLKNPQYSFPKIMIDAIFLCPDLRAENQK